MLSKAHAKYIQSLHLKKTRDEHGLFIAEGTKLVTELLKEGKFICKEICATEDWFLEQASLLQSTTTATCNTCLIHELQKISTLSTATSVLAIFEYATWANQFDATKGLTLILDGIQDPGNLGTIIRSADWFGVAQIVCSLHCADMYSPKVIQSTMGSLGRIPILYTDIEIWLQKYKLPVYAAAMEGNSIHKTKFELNAAIIIGNEGKGISANIMQLASHKITIPRKGRAESLNAAIACSIILSAIAQ